MKFGFHRMWRILHILESVAKVDNTLRDLQNSSYPTKANFNIIALLFLQNNSKFKLKQAIYHANLGWCMFIYNAFLSGSLGDKGLLSAVNMLQIADVVRLHAVLTINSTFLPCYHVFRQYFAVKRVNVPPTVPPFCSNNQNNSTSSPCFHDQQFNNLQPGCTFDIILKSSVQYGKILSKFGQQ